MGIFDDIKRLVDTATKPTQPGAPARPPPAQPSRGAATASGAKPHVAALEAAQKRRREKGATKKNGKKATPRDLKHYEALERALVLKSGQFPMDAAATRAALQARGFDAQHVEAYLASDAARRLLE